jgi:hypothetical protein
VSESPPGTGDIFIAGCARSGTTWLQTRLASHPEVASVPETHLFPAILGPADQSWRGSLARLDPPDADDRQFIGLPTVLTSGQFDEWLRELCATVRTTALAATPGAHRFLEKTPNNVEHLDLLRRLLPGARVVHLVRDPRSVVESLLLLSSPPVTRARVWAPSTVEKATELWARFVPPALARADDPNVHLVRYEDLVAGPEAFLGVLAFLDLDVGRAALPIEQAGSSPSALREHIRMPGEAARLGLDHAEYYPGFSFHDRAPDQVRTLSRFEERYVLERCAPTMAVLGYPVEARRPLPAPVFHARRAARTTRRRSRAAVGAALRALRGVP